MADHADHHHAAPAKPNATTTMGIALFVGVVTVLVALVGSIRDSSSVLTVALVLGIIAIGVAILGAIIAKGKGSTTRGFLVAVLLGASGIATWALLANV